MQYTIRQSDEPLLDFFEQLAEAGIQAYDIQEKAILEWGACDGGIMVTVPTGSGKTLIAEAAIFEALCKKQRVYYTTPLVALTEQKFREFSDRFGADKVGMVTGNKQINSNAPLIVAVAEILANRLLVPTDAASKHVADVVVFDEFHYFSDRERGWVWESSVLLLPSECKLMMLSATVSKTVPFMAWLDRERGRKHKLVESFERRVPLTYVWCEQLLPEAVQTIIDRNHAPCLIFAFDRVGCFAVANQMTSLPTGALLNEDEQKELQAELNQIDFGRGAGRRFRKLLFKGIGVHHAGVLPKWRQIVEDLFTRKLLKFVVCTETLAAGVNLPARTVMLPELVKYGGGSKKQILPAATAQQIFGRAGRPQFDDKGYVYVLAPPDEVKIKKWEDKIAKLGRTPTTKELSKKPKRDEYLVRWNNDQFRKLREAEPAPLESQAMPGYGALVFLLQEHELSDILALVNRKFAPPPMVRNAVEQVAIMLANLEALDYIETEAQPGEDGKIAPIVDAAPGKPDPAGRWRKLKVKSVNVDDRVVSALADDFENLLDFRGVHPLFAHWLSKRMEIGTIGEKLQVLEALIIQAKSMAGPDVDLDFVDHG
ncbi:MAG: DEAD/DEAH box helicase, partial [Planctomycetota bacterium]